MNRCLPATCVLQLPPSGGNVIGQRRAPFAFSGSSINASYLADTMAAHQTAVSEPHPTDGYRRGMVMLRIVIAVCLAPALVYLCLQTDHARLKGMPMESWRLVPLILTAAAAAISGRRFLNSVSGLFLGGIGGAFGTLDNSATPYGGVVGLLVGAIVVVLPVIHKPNSNTTTESATEGNEQAIRDGT